MNEREMLEMAAKAAGYIPSQEHIKFFGSGVHWNPLKDDGDALRLAVRLGMRINAYSTCVVVDTDYGLFAESADIYDLYAATRLAITRAAAEIGRSM